MSCDNDINYSTYEQCDMFNDLFSKVINQTRCLDRLRSIGGDSRYPLSPTKVLALSKC